jgi:hypothetical protein
MNPSKSVIGHKQYVKKKKLQAFVAGTGQRLPFHCCYLIPKTKRKSKQRATLLLLLAPGSNGMDEILKPSLLAAARRGAEGAHSTGGSGRPAQPARQYCGARGSVPARDTAAAGRTADGRPGARGAAAAGGAGRGTRARWPADGGAQLGALAAAGGRGAPPAVRLGVVGGLGNSASRSARRASTRRQSALVLGILKLWEDGQVQSLKNEGKSTVRL